MVFSFLSYPCKNLLLQMLFIGRDHVEQCTMFIQELLENKNRATSDVICQFYSWLFFAYTPLLVSSKSSTQNGH